MAFNLSSLFKGFDTKYLGNHKDNYFGGTDGNDHAVGLGGNDTLKGGNGNDLLIGNWGKDHLFGGAGCDKLIGGSGNDVMYGDGPAELVTTSVDFTTAAWLPSVTPDGTQINLTGLTVTMIGGVATQFQGLSVLSPSDNAPQGWTKEIDAYNDTQEGLKLDFGTAQTTATLTIAQIYKEKLFLTSEQEKVNITIHLADGSVVTTSVLGTATAFPGEITLTIDGSVTGGKAFDSVVLVPDTAPPPPSSIPAGQENTYNATHAFSEFTLKSVSYSYDLNETGKNDDCLEGGCGNDYLNGGYGNDILNGGSGCDTLVGGQGNDTFVFGRDTDKVTVKDFELDIDRAKFDCVSVKKLTQIDTNGDSVKDATQITLNNGGVVVFEKVLVTDWHDFL